MDYETLGNLSEKDVNRKKLLIDVELFINPLHI